MALINCPECGSEVSTAAVACPKCGRPLAPPVLEERTVIREVAPVVVERESFPKWIFIPLGVLGVVLIFLLFALFRQENEDQQNVNLKITAKNTSGSNLNSSTRVESSPNQITIPPVSTVPQNTLPTNGTTSTDIPVETTKPDRGNLSIDAKVTDRSGNPRAVRAEKFYLLDKDLESILSDADIEPISGQTLRDSFARSIVYPDKYPDIRRKALAEINKHIKYEVITDAGGKAEIKDVKPENYYLFAITKTANSYSIWSSQMDINAGQNILNLSPQPMTEVQDEE